MKVCVVCSPGGHLAEARLFEGIYGRYDHFYVLNDVIDLPDKIKDRTVFIKHAERDWKVLVNFLEAWKIISKHHPNIIFTTGAGPAIPFAIIGKLFGCKVIFIETVTRVFKPSLTARLIYMLADDFFVQWESLRKFFPKARYLRGLV